jgi:hypothetical protein
MDYAVSRRLTEQVSAEIQTAILPILEKYGLKITKFASKYGDSYGLTVSAVTTKLDESGVNLNSAEAIYYDRFGYCDYDHEGNPIKLTAKLGTKFDNRGRKFVFAGIRSRGKNKIVAKCEQDGKDYVFADTIIPQLNEASK